MSKERDEIRIIPPKAPETTAAPATSEVPDDGMPEAYRNMTLEQRKARLAVVLDRGVVHDRLKVELPTHLHGEWVRRDQLEIARMQTLGFWVDTKYATARSIHTDGSSANIVGDVIHMITTKENKELIDLVRREQIEASNKSPVSKEERDFRALTKTDTGGEIPTFAESQQRAIRISEVQAALAQADQQTQVQR